MRDLNFIRKALKQLKSFSNSLNLLDSLNHVSKSIVTFRHQSIILVFVCSSTGFLASCDFFDNLLNRVEDITTSAESVINDAIFRISNESADWREVLEETVEKLSGETQSTVRNEVQTLLTNAIGAAGSELVCVSDYVLDGLQGILAGLTGGTNLSNPSTPRICQVVPNFIDMSLEPNRRSKIEFWGYRFDQSGWEVILVEDGREVSVTEHLSIPSSFNMVLNLGNNGILLSEKSELIKLFYQGIELSNISIIQPVPDACQVVINSQAPNSIHYIPPHIDDNGSNRNFDDNGPAIECTVTIGITEDRKEIFARVFMSAEQTGNKSTLAEGTEIFPLFRADPGWEFTKIISPDFVEFSYIDNDRTLDLYDGYGPVRTFIFSGRDKGPDAGVHTGVRVFFEEIRYERVQVENCDP